MKIFSKHDETRFTVHKPPTLMRESCRIEEHEWSLFSIATFLFKVKFSDEFRLKRILHKTGKQYQEDIRMVELEFV